MATELEFLGTGTSTGVPQIGCHCDVCTSANPKDKRYRTSAHISINGVNFLIDCGPDFREQILRASNKEIDALLITHSHYDHVGGIDDLRPYCAEKPLPIFAKEDVLNDLRNRIPYCFNEHPYPGVPRFELNAIDANPFSFKGVLIEPLPVMHYKLPILGYKIGNLAYITDALTLDDATLSRIKGIDTLVINALRLKPHMSHMTLSDALHIIGISHVRRAYLIHLSHDMGLHDEVSKILPPNVHIAYDGLKLVL